MIQVKNLSFGYNEQLVLHNLQLEIRPGSFTAIVGANGSGKSTLVKHFNALLLPSIGDVLVDDINTKKNQFDVRKKVGFVFQNFQDQIVYPIVSEDIGFGLENLEYKSSEIKKITNEILEKLNIAHLAKMNVNTLSMGQKQLVALAGVLAMKPNYIIFDEPTTMLDATNKKNILSVMKELNEKDGLTIIMVTNVLEDLDHVDSVIILRDGRVIFHDAKKLVTKNLILEAGLYV
jgi:energy-coupling factor transport system ATP-binding protein